MGNAASPSTWLSTLDQKRQDAVAGLKQALADPGGTLRRLVPQPAMPQPGAGSTADLLSSATRQRYQMYAEDAMTNGRQPVDYATWAQQQGQQP